MGYRPFTDPNSNETLLVNQVIGRPYEVVRLVAENLSHVKLVADNMPELVSLFNVAETIQLVSQHMDAVQNVSYSISPIESVAANITQLNQIATNIDDLLLVVDQVGDAQAIYGVWQDVLDAADRAEAASQSVSNPVSFEPQTLSEPQKAQARTNIGVINATTSTVGNAVTGAEADTTIDDVDHVTGVRDASPTLVRWTWASVKTWIKDWISKGDVGLGNVDNTSDENKPVSIAQTLAINTKVTKTGDDDLGGFQSAEHDHGILPASFTPTIADGNFQQGNKETALVINAPATGAYSMQITITNTLGTDGLTASGFDKVNGVFRVDDGAKHILLINMSAAAKVLTIVWAS